MMNQERIGKYISECRKKKNMTQAELAAKLGVTDKSVSNWENGRNMPDLSLFKPLCEILGISINDLISGEKVTKDKYQEKFEENIINTIDYTNKKIKIKDNTINIIFIVIGILISITAMTIFPSDSSWGSIYSIMGIIISLVGISKFTKKLSYIKRILINISYFIIFTIVLFFLDTLSVISIKQVPRFAYLKEYSEKVATYKTPLYNVYRINRDTVNEYYIIDFKHKYNEDSLPISPFNRDKSGIDNIINYKNKYLGNNSNIGGLLSNLPLSEYGYTFEIDSTNLGLNINYHITGWYIDEDNYMKKALIYNSVSIFSLIDNVKEITYNFSGTSYIITRDNINSYPHYNDIVNNKENFNNYLEDKMNDDEFVLNIFNLFNVK